MVGRNSPTTEDNMNEDMQPAAHEQPPKQKYPYASSGVAPVEKKEKKLTAKQKKELIIVHSRMNFMVIKFAGGGQVPEELRGDWNNRAMAQRKIDLYLANRK